jgi:hypothetical protein
MVLIRSRMLSAVADANVSAQSPPCRTKASPTAALAIRSVRMSHSPAKTRGGYDARVSITSASAAVSGQLGCCWASSSVAAAVRAARASEPSTGSRPTSAVTVLMFTPTA